MMLRLWFGFSDTVDRATYLRWGVTLMAAVLEPTGMLVAFDEFGTGGDWRWASLIVTGGTGPHRGQGTRSADLQVR